MGQGNPHHPHRRRSFGECGAGVLPDRRLQGRRAVRHRQHPAGQHRGQRRDPAQPVLLPRHRCHRGQGRRLGPPDGGAHRRAAVCDHGGLSHGGRYCDGRTGLRPDQRHTVLFQRRVRDDHRGTPDRRRGRGGRGGRRLLLHRRAGKSPGRRHGQLHSGWRRHRPSV